jgi:hypothetical protein
LRHRGSLAAWSFEESDSEESEIETSEIETSEIEESEIIEATDLKNGATEHTEVHGG